MMQIVEIDDDYYENRLSNGSMSCLFPPLMCIDCKPRRSLSYDKLPQEPLRLTVIKLDGSCFGIKVAKTGTVGEVKRAVEAAFRHLPKNGPGKISWTHVWGQFCLCHEGQKLLNDGDYIGMFGIKDGDQNIRRDALVLEVNLKGRVDSELRKYIAISTYDLVRTKSEREDLDSDEPSISDVFRDEQQNGEKNDSHHIEIVEANQDDMESDNGDISSKFRFTNMLRGWFAYRKMTNSEMRIEERSSSSKLSLWFNSNKNDHRRETWKGE
ncbi:hypothetical protein ACJIZ3_023176 [Penstemon smallii]|uniref:SNRNP25 ubiquitin-like domain-containing protein n=1 Tax=Penstemon smallii TaxID=265156 RepID=A0ABD3TQN5_9LAMI